jgi:hypothetical protein
MPMDLSVTFGRAARLGLATTGSLAFTAGAGLLGTFELTCKMELALGKGILSRRSFFF